MTVIASQVQSVTVGAILGQLVPVKVMSVSVRCTWLQSVAVGVSWCQSRLSLVRSGLGGSSRLMSGEVGSSRVRLVQFGFNWLQSGAVGCGRSSWLRAGAVGCSQVQWVAVRVRLCQSRLSRYFLLFKI